MIKCGHCGKGHPTVAAVRDCAEKTRRTPIPRALRRDYDIEEIERDMWRMEAEADRAESLRDELAKAAHKASVETWDQPRDAAEFYEQMREGAALSELISLVDVLLVSREIPKEEWRWSRAVREMITTGSPTEFGLRTAIARLLSYPSVAPKPAVVAAAAQTHPAPTESKGVEREGLYRLSRAVRLGGLSYPKGSLFQVIRNKDATRLYAKRVTFLGEGQRPRLDYVAGMIFQLLPEELVDREEAQEITRKTGWCVFGHFLTNPKSIARGMGPKCYERYPHLARNAA